MAQEQQNTERMMLFFNGANFVKAAKFRRNNIFQRKKKDTSRFDQNTRKAVLSPVGCTAAERRGKLYFLF